MLVFLYGFIFVLGELDINHSSSLSVWHKLWAQTFIVSDLVGSGNSRGLGFAMIILSRHLMLPAIEAMNGQYLCNRQITASYAYKKHTKGSVMLLQQQSNCSKEEAAHFICQWTSNTSECSSANGTVPPRPFANGSVAPSPIPALRPPQGAAFHPMLMGGLLSWQAAIGSTNPTTCHASTTSAFQAPSPKYATTPLLHWQRQVLQGLYHH